MFWLSDGEEIMTLAFFVLMQYRSVSDGRTDRQTDIPPLAIPAVCIACYAKLPQVHRGDFFLTHTVYDMFSNIQNSDRRSEDYCKYYCFPEVGKY